MKIQKFFDNLSSDKKIIFIIEVYDILVENGASESMRNSFTHYMLDKDSYYKEWRFQGKLGFGGKYYFPENKIDCYSEDYEDSKILIEEANKKLRQLIT